jgi:hypothetical protein
MATARQDGSFNQLTYRTWQKSLVIGHTDIAARGSSNLISAERGLMLF